MENTSQTTMKNEGCKLYNSGLNCPGNCNHLHSIDKKNTIQKLFELNLYIRDRSGFLNPKFEEIKEFYEYLNSLTICHKYYLHGECAHGALCWYVHVLRKDQKNALKPQIPIKDEDKQKVQEKHIEISKEKTEKKPKKNFEKNGFCKKCERKKANCMFFPCGDCNYCLNCATEMLTLMKNKCSLCFKKVQRIEFD